MCFTVLRLHNYAIDSFEAKFVYFDTFAYNAAIYVDESFESVNEDAGFIYADSLIHTNVCCWQDFTW